jgi:hypothetical protein
VMGRSLNTIWLSGRTISIRILGERHNKH